MIMDNTKLTSEDFANFERIYGHNNINTSVSVDNTVNVPHDFYEDNYLKIVSFRRVNNFFKRHTIYPSDSRMKQYVVILSLFYKSRSTVWWWFTGKMKGPYQNPVLSFTRKVLTKNPRFIRNKLKNLHTYAAMKRRGEDYVDYKTKTKVKNDILFKIKVIRLFQNTSSLWTLQFRTFPSLILLAFLLLVVAIVFIIKETIINYLKEIL